MTGPEIAALGRLARRTARRNWKRTAFIVALIAIPVAAAQVGAGMMAAGDVAPEEYATQELGAADANVSAFQSSPAVRAWIDSEIAAIAPRAQVQPYRNVYGSIPNVASYVEVTDLDPTAPLAAGKLAVVSGRVPQRAGEVALSNALLTLTGVEIGDEVELALREVSQTFGPFTVVGVVRDVLWKNSTEAIVSVEDMDEIFTTDWAGAPIYREARWLIGGIDEPEFSAELYSRWETARPGFLPDPAVTPTPDALIDLPHDLYRSLTAVQVGHLEEYAATHEPWEVEEEGWRLVPYVEFPGVGISTRGDFGGWESGVDEVLQAPPVLGTLGAALLLTEVALVAGAAYATGTRRRLRELGLMSVNGATEQHLRWAVIGEGLFTGVLGAVIGTAGGVSVLVLGRPVMQRFIDRLVVGVPVGPFELLGPAVVGIAAATIAAWVPARTAAKVPATTALQGRMPLNKPRRWVGPLGLGMGGAGAFLLVVAKTADGNSGAYQAGLAVVLMIGGFALLAGPLVEWVGGRADRLPATLRLVARDSARQRTRAATAMAATMVVLVAPVLMGIAVQTDQELRGIYGLPEDGRQVLVGAWDWRTRGELSAEAVDEVATLLPNAVQAGLHVYDGAAVLSTVEEATPSGLVGGASDGGHPGAIGIAEATPSLIDALDLRLTEQEVAEAGAIVLGRGNGWVEVTVGDSRIRARELPVSVLLYSAPRLLVTRSVADSVGLVGGFDAVLFVNDRPLTEKQRLAASHLDLSIGSSTPITVSYVSGLTALEIELLGVGATLVVVLIIIALVTALSATESDHDLRTMVAVGAPPRIRRRFLGAQTLYYTMFAAALATPLALLLYKVSVNDWGQFVGPFGVRASSSMVIPWVEIGVVAIVVPLVVGVVTALTVRSAATVPPRRVG